ncbi:MAG TPA: adenosine-specific kinase [candidate division Zixibacteria bacterium]
MKTEQYKIQVPEGANLILGQTHFIKTAEDLYEILVSSVPNIKFGLAFCEASGPCLVRHEGNDEKLRSLAKKTAFEIGAGHIFVIFIEDAYPINVLRGIKECAEVCSIFCATANPVELLIAQTEQGRGVIGVVDGFSPKGIEEDKDIKERKQFLRKIGYKL